MASKTLSITALICLFVAPLSGFSQETDVVRSIPLSSSSSLVIKKTTENLASSPANISPAPSGFTRVNLPAVKETFFVTFQSGNSKVDIKKEEFRSVKGAGDSVMPRFTVIDAALDGDSLRFLYTKEGKVHLVVATIATAGSISRLRETDIPYSFPSIADAHFVRDDQNKSILRINIIGNRDEAFRFDSAGNAISVSKD